MRSDLQSVLASLDIISRDHLPQLMSELEFVRAAAILKMSEPPPPQTEERWLTAEEVAEQLGVSTKTVYRRAPRWPFTRRDGAILRFSSRGLTAYKAKSRNM